MRNYQREYKRIDYQQQIQLTTHDGMHLFAKSKNLSMGGLELVCNQKTAKTMMPFGYQLDPDAPLLLTLEFCLSDSNAPLRATCRVKNMRRLAQDAFSFHLTFTEFKKTGKQVLEGFMEQ